MTLSTARWGLLAAVVVAGSMTAQGSARQATTRPPVARVPLSFTAPHGYAGAEDYLKKVAAAYPGITDLLEIGKSAAGRPIHVLVVSNMKTGVTMDRLVPLAHPRTPPTNNVTPMKSYQGKPGQWIDGGPRGTDMAGAEACLYIIDKLVSAYGTDAEITRLVDDNAFYVCPVVNPDATAGQVQRAAQPAANGNFPEGWWKDDATPGGSGDYPSSQPEARAVLEFFTNHTNILLVQSFDTTGGHALRPYARWPESRVDARDVAVFDGVLGKKYVELMGEKDMARAWRSAYTNAPAGYGVFFDWAYGQFGAFAMAAQLSEAQTVPADRLAALCETAWQFERYKATLLPRVAITEATAKVLYNTNQATRAVATHDGDTVSVKNAGAPGPYKVVQVTATVENAGALPTQVAGGPQLRGNREDVIWLLGDKVTFLEGTRWTRLGVLDGTLTLPAVGRTGESGRGGRGGGGGGRGGGGASLTPLAQMRQQAAETPVVRQSGNRRSVSWLIAVEGATPLKLALSSQKGGTVVKELTIQ